MIFSMFPRVAVKLGTERYDFDRSTLMFKEVVAIEDATGLSFGEWQFELGRYSIRAIAGLLHVLRQRAGVPGDFGTMNFSADDLECVPLHDDGTEFTAGEVAADITRRVEEAKTPTGAAPAAATASTSPVSPNGTESVPGSGTGSPGPTSTSSSVTPTPG